MSGNHKNILDHLGAQLARGRAVLFTGAGFSLTAENRDGEPIPSVGTLARDIWNLVFPGDDFDDAASLQDIFEAALGSQRKALAELLTRKLSVRPDSIDSWIGDYFRFPWHRIYTLNVDTLIDGVQQRFDLPRNLNEVSATDVSSTRLFSPARSPALDVVALNGTMADVPDGVTFSSSQYARRIAWPDQLYQQLVADLVSRPVVFVGTSLDESPLWQNVEVRRARGPRGSRELRPRSYLVTPKLDRARESRLAGFNIAWIKMTAEEFAHEILRELAEPAAEGVAFLKASQQETTQAVRIDDVADLATHPERESEFLLGEEPIWADIQSGRAVRRDVDDDFDHLVQSRMESDAIRGAVVIAGTAGSGKSTSLMAIALRASAKGHRVGWIDRNSGHTIRSIIRAMKSDEAPEILAIDEAEALGVGVSSLIRDLAGSTANPLIVASIRSGAVDRMLNPAVLGDTPIQERTVPSLTDSDIESLLAILDRENRLGVLKGKSKVDQEAAFRDQAGRQLLVAMISATSGVKFEEKVPNEFFELPDEAQLIYAIVALATTFRYGVSRQDLLIALNESSNSVLNTLDSLIRRHLLVNHPPESGLIQTRHRVIAELLRDELQKRGQLTEAVFGLGFLAATHTSPAMWRDIRAYRLLRGVTNHDFLHRTIGLDAAKSFYQNLEDLLAGDSHYWLQRGSLEVEFGDLRLAENFLGQARGLAPSDLLIDNEWAYLLFRKAIMNPAASSAAIYVREATDLLESLISDPRSQPHPFHVLGSQGLAWSRRGISDRRESATFLRSITSRVDDGLLRFPKNRDLRKLKEDLQREYLLLAVPESD